VKSSCCQLRCAASRYAELARREQRRTEEGSEDSIVVAAVVAVVDEIARRQTDRCWTSNNFQDARRIRVKSAPSLDDST